MALFCVDTSAWLDGWVRYYPRDIFVSLWVGIETSVDAGDIIASEEVYRELARKDDDLHKWMLMKKHMLISTEENVQEHVGELLGKYPRLVDTLKGRSQADPFVIGTAIEHGATVVTGEAMGTVDRPRIPFVCHSEGIRCITFLEMIRELKLSF